MYEGLVKRLRYAASYDERLVIEDCKEAADAIEELIAECDNLHDALIGLDAVVPYWIPVSERLPERMERVLVYSGIQGIRSDMICNDGSGWYRTACVTHWMPLPEPPYGDAEVVGE